MSTLQHTSQLRQRASHRVVLVMVIAALAAAGLAAAIIAIASGGGTTTVPSSPVVTAQPMYMGGALEHQLPAVKAAQAAAQASSPDRP